MPVRPAIPDPHLVAPWQPSPLGQLAKAGPWQNAHQARANEAEGVAGKTAGIQRVEVQRVELAITFWSKECVITGIEGLMSSGSVTNVTGTLFRMRNEK